MNTTILLTWLVRFGHVAAAAMWLGGYLVLAFIMAPALKQNRNETLERAALLTVRVLSYAGTATMLLGLLLVARTRGYVNMMNGEWGMIVMTCFVIAFSLLGIGDGALRPALRRISEPGQVAKVQRLATLGFVLTVVAMALMTRALYATS